MLNRNETYIKDSFWDLTWSRSYVSYEKHHQLFWDLIKENVYGSVLDLGCGSGSCWKEFKGSSDITGVDFSEVGCLEFTRNTGYKAICSKIEDLDIEDTFDTVVIAGVINYYRDLFKIKQQLRKYAKRRIIMTINVIQDFKDRVWDEETIRHEFRFLGEISIQFYEKIGWFIIIDTH